MNNQSAIIIGKIVATHGIKGWLVIQSFSYPSENIKNYNTFLKMSDKNNYIKIINLKLMPKKIIIQLENYNDINDSEKIVGKDIFIDVSEIPDLNDGEYYWKDIEGLEVYTTQDYYLGTVDFIFNNGANDVLAVKKNQSFQYIPYIREHINIILGNKIIINHEII